MPKTSPGGSLVPVDNARLALNSRYPIRRHKTTIGRGTDCDVHIPDASVSRLHAELTWTENGLTLFHHSTTSPTYLNGVPVVESAVVSSGDLIEINSPPLSGIYSGNNAAFEAIVTRPSPSFLSRLIHGDQVFVAVRAVATVANPGGTPCVLALDSSMPDAVMINNGSLSTGGCRVQANSTDPGALHNFSNGELDADTINVVGGYEDQGWMSSTPTTGVLPVPDPFAGIPTPGVGGCDYTDVTFSGNQVYNLSPGTYCGGISVAGKADVRFAPGTYVITDSAGNPGSLHVTGNHASVTGSDVTFYTDGDSTINVGGQGVVDLQAPQSGSYSGMLFIGDPDASPSTQHSITGNGNMLYEGFMYFRTAVLKVNGNGNGEASNYMGAVARQIRFGGNGELVMNYDPTDPDVPIVAGGSTVAMVE